MRLTCDVVSGGITNILERPQVEEEDKEAWDQNSVLLWHESRDEVLLFGAEIVVNK